MPAPDQEPVPRTDPANSLSKPNLPNPVTTHSSEIYDLQNARVFGKGESAVKYVELKAGQAEQRADELFERQKEFVKDGDSVTFVASEKYNTLTAFIEKSGLFGNSATRHQLGLTPSNIAIYNARFVERVNADGSSSPDTEKNPIFTGDNRGLIKGVTYKFPTRLISGASAVEATEENIQKFKDRQAKLPKAK